MTKTLVILAAGIGSRFGGGIKQLEPIDDNGHIIIDYSIHDAIATGFNSIIFIIRHSIEAEFKTIIGDRIESTCKSLGVKVSYAYQEIENTPDFQGKEEAFGRTKPWGTGHAVLACEGMIDGPFAVINADDYYGKNGFKTAAVFLGKGYALVGYQLKNTLSDNGGVTRGICTVENGRLSRITETKNIVKTSYGAAFGGQSVDVNSLVSMNFWCYPAEFMDELKGGFPEFLRNMSDPQKDEYLLPIIADGMLKKGISFSVLPTDDKWFGVTYKEDKPAVVESFRNLIQSGVYREDLYSDLQKLDL